MVASFISANFIVSMWKSFKRSEIWYKLPADITNIRYEFVDKLIHLTVLKWC